MIEPQLEHYSNLLLKLKRGYNKGFGKAPHKPILILAVLEQIREGNYTSNKIFVTPELVLSFKNHFKLLVDTGHKDNISLPFFHMRSEPFWRLVIKPGFELKVTSSKSIKSFKNLVESVAFAEIDRTFFILASNPLNNELIKTVLLDYYFPSTKKNLNFATNDLEDTIENQILNESKLEYQTRLNTLKQSLKDDDLAEELFIRGGVFKTTIPKTYDYTCCISGMKIQSDKNAQMVDACHIIPFSISYNDTVPNGVSLSPNLHRAFDRGLITIKDDYTVRVSPSIIDNNSVYSITQFDGQQIILPNNIKHYPSPESLIWHNKEVYVI